MKTAATFTLILAAILISPANAFDGERKGFVFGGGLGYASSIKTTVDVSAGDGFGNDFFLGTLEGNEPGLAGHLMIGFGLDEHNLLVLESNVGVYSIANIDLFGDGFLYEVQFAQGVGTVSWYRYWGRRGASLFTAIGAGLSYFDTDYTNPNDYGAAWLAAIGYEFTPHAQIGLYWTGGQTTFSEIPGLEGNFSQSTLSVMISAVAF
ncbi:hypothetical protein GF420_16155 [candidate division GN15 bacterium]|nr:hypothetical protein [candidate division GN15 bacterium]